MIPRTHIVLVPGFGGFDALGSLEYYTGVTELLRGGDRQAFISVHYFPNFPTASVATRAKALLEWLAKLFRRGILQPLAGGFPGDNVHLVGHSTGGMDIQHLMLDLMAPTEKDTSILGIPARSIRQSLRSIQFLSTPHHGTTLAHYVGRNEMWIRRMFGAVYETDRALRGKAVSNAARGVARLGRPEGVFRAILDSAKRCDAPKGDGLAQADARGVYFDTLRWLLHISNDFKAISDLDPYGTTAPRMSAGAWRRREQEATAFRAKTRSARLPEDRVELFSQQVPADLSLVSQPEIQSVVKDYYQEDVALRSIVTVATPEAGAPALDPFKLVHGITARKLPAPKTERERSSQEQLAKSYSLQTLQSWVDGGPPQRVEIGPSDNDGIVNSVSMVWPDAQRSLLVRGDHGDIIGHYAYRDPTDIDEHCRYDLLRCAEGFDAPRFQMVWTSIREFALASEPGPT
ncbi:MAG: hypothetical protein ABJE95_29365 [Byssovorax sp.]